MTTYGLATTSLKTTVIHIMRDGKTTTLCGVRANWTTSNPAGWNPCIKCEKINGGWPK